MDDKVKELINTIDARKKEYMDKMQDYSASYFNTKIRELDGVLNDIFLDIFSTRYSSIHWLWRVVWN